MMDETVECGYCEEQVLISDTVEKEDRFFGGTFRVCNPCEVRDEWEEETIHIQKEETT